MKLTVVIVNYNVKHYLYQCLYSLYRSIKKMDAEVYVVDNHSRDGSIEYVSKKFPDVNYVESNHNLGFARANNIAIRQSEGEYILLLNPDTIVGEDTISQVLDFMDAHPQAGGVGVKMLRADGTKAMESRRGLPTPMTAFYKMAGLCKRYPESRRFGHYYMGYLPWDKPEKIEVISGAFCMLRNSATNRKTGECELSDREVADYTRAIVTWVNSLTIENYKNRIAEHEKNLAVLKKDAKKNAEGIKDVEGKIEACKSSIKHCEDIIDYVTDPSTDIVDSLIEDYKDAKSDNNRAARSIFKQVFESYYADVDLEKNDMANVYHNVKQRAGIIVNLFRDPTTPNLQYSEANLTEMTLVEPTEEEGKKE